jgi:branched-chain amino acid aminotransferase
MSLIPFDDRDGHIWLDGKLVPWREAKIHVLTHGLHYGSSIFEGQRVYNRKIFKLEQHTERLFQSARLMGFEIPYTQEQINAASMQVVEAQGLDDAYMRPVAWRGSEQMAVSAQKSKIHVAIAVWPWPSMFDPEIKKKGIALDIARWRRPAPDTTPWKAKAAGLYMICTISKHAAEKAGFTDAMMLDYRGYVAESTGSNVFFVKDGVLHTPTPDCFLNGITRQTVIKLARSKGFEVIERHILPEELSGFSECFVVGSAAEVTPVAEIGEYRFRPGNISLSLMDDYARMVRRELAPV